MKRCANLMVACVVLAAGSAAVAQSGRSGKGLVEPVDSAISYDPTWEVAPPTMVLPPGGMDGAGCWNDTGTQCWEGKLVGIGLNNPSYPLHVATNGQWAGVFQGVSLNSRGVFGAALATTGLNYGGFFTSGSTSGVGVFGKAAAGSGVNIGVKGESSSPNGWAGFFVGNQYTTGSVQVGGGSLFVGAQANQAGNWKAVVRGGDSLLWDSDLAMWKTGSPIDWRIRTESNKWFVDEFGNGRHFTIAPGGNIGIGNAAHDPNVKLDVAGDVKIRTQNNGLGYRLYFGEPGENTDTFYFERQNFASNGTVLRLQIGDDGGTDSFDIGSGLGAVFTCEAGGVCRNLTGSWAQISDARLKNSIQPLTGSLDRILQLQGKTFQYNDPKAIGAMGGLRTGFVAQEVERVFPEWVIEDRLGYKNIQISGFEALTVESLRELRAEKDAQIAELRADNQAKQQQIDELEARLARLETLVATK